MLGQPSDKFAWGADVVVSQCMLCKHLDRSPGSAAVCAAFPGAIPQEILRNEVDHRKPYVDPATGRVADKGIALDRSITFEPQSGLAPEALDVLYRHLDQL